MEFINECGIDRVKITGAGSRTTSTESTGRAEAIRCILREKGVSFEDYEIGSHSWVSSRIWKRGTIFVGCAVTKCPNANQETRITIEGTKPRFTKAHTRPEIHCDASVPAEDRVTFYYRHGRAPRATWFIDSKTLVMHSEGPIRIDETKRMIDVMIKKGFVVSTTAPAAEDNQYFVAEYHHGERRMVAVNYPKITCTVGADPEFEIVRRGAVVDPDRSVYSGLQTPIGLDGQGRQIEIRPPAKKDAALTTLEIKKLMNTINDCLSTVGHKYPVGGHIHIGVGHRYDPPADLLWLLDYFIGYPTIRLSGRARGHYQTMSAFENKPWGFEYRTPPAAIFATARFAYLAMKAAKAIVEAYINKRCFVVDKIDQQTIPTCDAYRNYAGFSSSDYREWVAEIESQKALRNSPNCYRTNIAHFWNSEKASDTGEPATEPATASATASARCEPRPTVGIRFSSDTFSDIVRQALTAQLSSHPYLATHSVRIFGLNESRGNVTSGYNAQGANRIEVAQTGFGMPYSARVLTTTDDMMSLQAHIDGIAAELDALNNSSN